MTLLVDLQQIDDVLDAIAHAAINVDQLGIDIRQLRLLGAQVKVQRTAPKERLVVGVEARRKEFLILGNELAFAPCPFKERSRSNGRGGRHRHQYFTSKDSLAKQPGNSVALALTYYENGNRQVSGAQPTACQPQLTWCKHAGERLLCKIFFKTFSVIPAT